MLESGAQCATAVGTILMLLSFVCNWDFKEQVHHTNKAVLPHNNILLLYVIIQMPLLLDVLILVMELGHII